MFTRWDVVPEDGRPRWELEPFARVGPLGFGMSPGEVAEELSAVTRESPSCTRGWPAGAPDGGVVRESRYRTFGLHLYFREERLAGVVVDALCGPQVLAEGTALVGRVPSDVERWMTERAEARPPRSELVYLASGVPGSGSLGVVVDVQRAGDHLLTRPVFVPREALDDLSHFLPRAAWSSC